MKHSAKDYISNLAADIGDEAVLDFIIKNDPAFARQVMSMVWNSVKEHLGFHVEQGIILDIANWASSTKTGFPLVVSWNSFMTKDLEALAKKMRKEYGPYNNYL